MKKMWNLFAALFVMAAVVMTSCSNPSDGGGSTPSITDIIKGVAIADYYASAEIGDIILADGTICKPDNFNSSKMKAIAVIIRKTTATKPALGVGIKASASKVEWSKTGKTATTEMIDDLKLSLLNTQFIGFSDGENSFNKLKNKYVEVADPTVLKNGYPAWDYAKNYAARASLTATLTDGWFFPSASELNLINTVNDQGSGIIKTSLSKAGGNDFWGATINTFWTCNQYSGAAGSAIVYNMKTKTAAPAVKDSADGYVIAMRTFSFKPDYDKAKVGDIILESGLITKADDFCNNEKVAAVVVREKNGTKPTLGTGITRLTEGNTSWCTTEADGYNKSITGLIDLDNGKTSLQILAASCSDLITHPERYPAFKYCTTYGVINNLSKVAGGWYLPTVDEYKSMYENYTTVNATLAKLQTVLGTDAVKQLLPNTSNFRYITCNQSTEASSSGYPAINCCYGFETSTSTKQPMGKQTGAVEYYVRAVRAFENTSINLSVAKPKISPSGGQYTSPTEVTITCSTEGAKIYYKINYKGEYKEYTGPITVQPDSDVYAFATKGDVLYSDVAEAHFYRPVY